MANQEALRYLPSSGNPMRRRNGGTYEVRNSRFSGPCFCQPAIMAGIGPVAKRRSDPKVHSVGAS